MAGRRTEVAAVTMVAAEELQALAHTLCAAEASVHGSSCRVPAALLSAWDHVASSVQTARWSVR